MVEKRSRFVARFRGTSPDDSAAANFVRDIVNALGVEPHSVVVLDAEVRPEIIAPLAELAPDAIGGFHEPFLFLMRSIDSKTIEALHEFCWHVMSDIA